MQDLSVKDYDGENINMVTSAMKGAYKILSNKLALPIDFLNIVFDVLEACSVEKFVLHVRGICTNHDQRIKIVDLNYLLSESENKYQSGRLAKMAAGQDSTFAAADAECRNCSERGHYSNECPHPKNESRFGRGCGRGRGRGGRGCGVPTTQTYDRQRDPRFKPPVQEDPRVQNLGNVVAYWCGTCRCWTNHPTNKHTEITMLASRPGNLKVGDPQVNNESKVRNDSNSSNQSSLAKSFAGILTHFG